MLTNPLALTHDRVAMCIMIFSIVINPRLFFFVIHGVLCMCDIVSKRANIRNLSRDYPHQLILLSFDSESLTSYASSFSLHTSYRTAYYTYTDPGSTVQQLHHNEHHDHEVLSSCHSFHLGNRSESLHAQGSPHERSSRASW